jgi:hypothetical protein
MLASVHHKHIIPFFGACISGPDTFIVTEYAGEQRAVCSIVFPCAADCCSYPRSQSTATSSSIWKTTICK